MFKTPTKPTAFKDRLAKAKTAYLTIPKTLSAGEKAAAQLAQVRRAFPHLRIKAFATEFKSGTDWQENFAGYIAKTDVLIVGCDSTRLVGPGVLHEINAARKAGKLIVVFKLDDDQPRRYCGYERSGSKEWPIIRLKKRADVQGGRRETGSSAQRSSPIRHESR